ncbi:MAG: DUF3450 family protein [Planctomycetes bacterium]|nr:DUF3450 family protein [Planctomycetota bacterium]
MFAAVLAAGAFLSAPGLSALRDAEEVDLTRAALERWVETRRVISKERQDWKLGREVLQDRIGVVSEEIESLRGRIGAAEADIAEADVARAALIAQNDDLKAAAATLEDAVAGLEARTLALLPKLPQPLRERVKPLSQQIPSDPSDTKLTLSLRYQNVIGLLNAVNKFNTEITQESEVHELGEGKSAEVSVLYLGLGQGYFVNADGTAAAVGRPADSGWMWAEADHAAPQILQAVQVRREEKPAAFVRLPIVID